MKTEMAECQVLGEGSQGQAEGNSESGGRGEEGRSTETQGPTGDRGQSQIQVGDSEEAEQVEQEIEKIQSEMKGKEEALVGQDSDEGGERKQP